MKFYEGRNSDLKRRINNHLSKLTGKDIDFYSSMGQSDLIELKTVLSDIHNVLTFRTTIAAANWLCEFFELDNDCQASILKIVDETKPNTKGFDILIEKPYKIIAEVKCISPMNNGEKFGAAQWNSILDDCHKLKNGKRTLADTSEYYKFIFLLDLGTRTDEAIKQLLRSSKGTSDKPLRANRHAIKEFVTILAKKEKLSSLSNERVYLRKIGIDK